MCSLFLTPSPQKYLMQIETEMRRRHDTVLTVGLLSYLYLPQQESHQAREAAHEEVKRASLICLFVPAHNTNVDHHGTQQKGQQEI